MNKQDIIALVEKYRTSYCAGTQMTNEEGVAIFEKWAAKGMIAPIQWVEKAMKKSIRKMSMAEYHSGTQSGAHRANLGSKWS
jgi:hypothetical protein